MVRADRGQGSRLRAGHRKGGRRGKFRSPAQPLYPLTIAASLSLFLLSLLLSPLPLLSKALLSFDLSFTPLLPKAPRRHPPKSGRGHPLHRPPPFGPPLLHHRPHHLRPLPAGERRQGRRVGACVWGGRSGSGGGGVLGPGSGLRPLPDLPRQRGVAPLGTPFFLKSSSIHR